MHNIITKKQIIFYIFIALISVIAIPETALAWHLNDAKSAVRIRDFQKAYIIYKALAREKNKEAQYQLASMYKAGRGVKQNDKSAVYWFEKAALQGNPKAQYHLAISYEKGEGTNSDIKQAIKWYSEAARQNHRQAQKKLKKNNFLAGGKKTSTKSNTKTLNSLLHRAALKNDTAKINSLLSRG
ncbi:hypothetical protein MNBD_GAMMA08-2071, partial [hydrothermal vent metagenome]